MKWEKKKCIQNTINCIIFDRLISCCFFLLLYAPLRCRCRGCQCQCSQCCRVGRLRTVESFASIYAFHILRLAARSSVSALRFHVRFIVWPGKRAATCSSSSVGTTKKLRVRHPQMKWYKELKWNETHFRHRYMARSELSQFILHCLKTFYQFIGGWLFSLSPCRCFSIRSLICKAVAHIVQPVLQIVINMCQQRVASRRFIFLLLFYYLFIRFYCFQATCRNFIVSLLFRLLFHVVVSIHMVYAICMVHVCRIIRM